MSGPSNQHPNLVCREKISNIWCLKTLNHVPLKVGINIGPQSRRVLAQKYF